MSMKRNNSPFFDGRLLHRVRAIVNTKSCLDSEEIATRLQNLHSEYSRRKRGPFIKLVARACEVISRENDMGDDEIVNIDSDDDLDITPSSPQPEGPNIMNSMMSNMYGKMPKNIPLSPIYASCSREDSRNSSTCGSDTKQNLSMNEDSVFFIDKKGSNSSSTLNQSLNKSVQLNATTEEKKMPQSEINTEKKTEKTPKKRKGQGRERDDESLPSKKNKGPEVQTSSVTFNDFGGNEKCLIEICKLLVHMNHPEVYQQIGVTPPRGFLLHGPPGCGKTLLAHAVVGELGLPFLKVAAPELVSGVSGESEQKVRDLFDKAISLAPCIVFIDEIDAITPKREVASKDMEKRIVAQLLYCMDELSKKENAHVLVIGATNRVDSLDPALRRAGRFDREVCLGIPNENARKKILQVLCKGLRIQEDFDYEFFAKNTPGFVGADLSQFVRESAMTAVNRVFDQIKKNNDSKNSVVTEKSSSAMEVDCYLNVAEVSKCDSSDEYLKTLYWLKNSSSLTSEQMEEIYITFEDFNKALKHVQPSAKREGFATVPDVTWDDIGALNLVREDLQLAILAPVRHAKQFENLGLSRAQGILLAGPPGCGKTLLAKAIANESGINFISVKGPELLNMYVGESERAVRLVFQRARNSAPCVIFFDELDALCPRRTDSGEGGSSVRVVNQLLTEMDGLEDRKQVYIIGATNRPDIIDPAILRPGRLDRTIYVGLPTPEDRLDIMRAITKQGTKPKFTPDVDLKNIANDERCGGFTGADMAALIREASLCALRDVMKSEQGFLREVLVTGANFESAFLRVKPSISKRDMLKYEKMKDNLAI